MYITKRIHNVAHHAPAQCWFWVVLDGGSKALNSFYCFICFVSSLMLF